MTTSTELGVAAALVRLSHEVNRVFGEVSREYALTPQQTQLLCLLAAGPVGMTEITRALHLEKSSVTGLVDRVARRGLVERVRDEDDRRVCQIVLSEKGEQLALDSHEEISARLEAMVGKLPSAERRQLAQTLQQLTQL